MTKILEEIQKSYKDYKEIVFPIDLPICERAPFSGSDTSWYYIYLFPEIIPFRNYSRWPCSFFTEETILRIMSEHGMET